MLRGVRPRQRDFVSRRRLAPFPIGMALPQQRNAPRDPLGPLDMTRARVFGAARIVKDDHRRASPPLRLCAGFFRRDVASRLRRRLSVQSPPLEQRSDLWFAATGEIPELAHRILAASARKEHLAETVAVLTLQAAVLLDPLHGVRVEHFAPNIGVVASGVAAGEGVREISGAITRRHRLDS